MASPSLFSISALSYLMVFFSVNPYASLGSSEKVEVSLYYETLCPFCANFIVNHLVKIFQNGLISAVNLRLVPWGNAWTNPNGSVICQVTPLSQFLFSFLSFFLFFLLLILFLSYMQQKGVFVNRVFEISVDFVFVKMGSVL